MRLGLIARADNRGLGQQTWAAYRNLKPAKTMVVDCPSAQPLKMHYDRYPDATIIKGLPSSHDIEQFLHGIDVLYTAETGYSHHIWDLANQAGVRTVLHANYEFLDPHDKPTVWAAPSLWNIDRWPAGTVQLPVPIETDRLTPEKHGYTASRFLHIVGRPAIHDRNGTLDLLQSLQHVTATIEVTIKCQQPGWVGGLINEHSIRTPGNVTLTIDSGDTEHYWDNYRGYDALILPRRFGGLCLPANEAIGAGIPVIMPNIDPNNTWLPAAWLIPAHLAGDFSAKQHITYYRTDICALAAKLDQLATDEDFYGHSLWKATQLRECLSWKALTPRYREVFAA